MQSQEFVRNYIKPYPFIKESFTGYIKPYPFPEELYNNVYAKVITDIDEIESVDTRYVYISLVNSNMLEIDEQFFNPENVDDRMHEIYKPYYYEFIAVISNSEQLETIKTIIQQSDGDWFHAELIHHNLENRIEDIIGSVEFSASPFRESGMALKFNSKVIDDKTLKKLNGTYTYKKKTDKSIQAQVDKLLSINFMYEHYNVIMYDVGQANCLYIKSNSGKQRILFDVGLPKLPPSRSLDRNRKSVQSAERSLSHINPTLVILSHWDIDHIKGAFLLDKQVFDRYWIAPDFRNLTKRIPVSMQRLAKYLDYKDRLLFIPSSLNGKLVSQFNNVFLWKGDSTHGSLSKFNNSGLILQLNQCQNTIFAGDCEYKCWPQKLQLQLSCNKNLFVPHHCSNMDTNYLRSKCSYMGCRKAMISCGEDARLLGLKHPDNVHLKQLTNKGYVKVISKVQGKYQFGV